MDSKNEKKGIVLNKMYAGWYLDENIGHEIINLFKADNNTNYIYLCKDGKYPKYRNLPKYTVQVRKHSTRTLEIISVAEIGNKVSLDEIINIKYGGKLITDIFDSNKEQGIDTYVTFKATCVIKPHPLHPVYIAYEGNRRRKERVKNPFVQDDKFILNENNAGKYNFDVNEYLRNYIDENNAPNSDYSKLIKIITDAFDAFNDKSGLWVAVDDKITIDKAESEKIDNEVNTTPAEIYGIGNLELPYSNAFSFFLNKYPKLLSGFCQYLNKDSENKKLDDLCSYCTQHPNATLTIKREWKNIDILIEIDKKWVIVVENKIFSDLNGKVTKETTQLDKYYSIIENCYKGWNKLFVLLTPNHNNIDIKQYTNWRKLFYSSVAEYLNTIEEINADRDLKAFSIMVERHSDIDYNYGEMRRRFIKAINRAKSNL